jgi:mRNA-degrading endonuclease RelE of RelBE toxin-antitoxin system
MNHFTLPSFWQHYQQLPKQVQELADKNYALLTADPHHPSLRFKKVGKKKQLWSVRVGDHYRALGLDKNEGVVWFWIGTHSEYDKYLE